MLNDLKYYFTLIKQFRSPTSNILHRQIITQERLPKLRSRTKSNCLKLAISKFLAENGNATSYSKGN